jgi:hypothetical protein
MSSPNEPCFWEKRHGTYTADCPDAPIENWQATPHRVRDAFDQSQMTRVTHYQHAGLHRPSFSRLVEHGA